MTDVFSIVPGEGQRQSWYDDMHTAEDIAAARAVLMKWIEHTGNTEAGARVAEAITDRAVELSLETV